MIQMTLLVCLRMVSQDVSSVDSPRWNQNNPLDYCREQHVIVKSEESCNNMGRNVISIVTKELSEEIKHPLKVQSSFVTCTDKIEQEYFIYLPKGKVPVPQRRFYRDWRWKHS